MRARQQKFIVRVAVLCGATNPAYSVGSGRDQKANINTNMNTHTNAHVSHRVNGTKRTLKRSGYFSAISSSSSCSDFGSCVWTEGVGYVCRGNAYMGGWSCWCGGLCQISGRFGVGPKGLSA